MFTVEISEDMTTNLLRKRNALEKNILISEINYIGF